MQIQETPKCTLNQMPYQNIVILVDENLMGTNRKINDSYIKWGHKFCQSSQHPVQVPMSFNSVLLVICTTYL